MNLCLLRTSKLTQHMFQKLFESIVYLECLLRHYYLLIRVRLERTSKMVSVTLPPESNRQLCCERSHAWHRDTQRVTSMNRPLYTRASLLSQNSKQPAILFVLRLLAGTVYFFLVLLACVAAKGALLLIVANILPQPLESASCKNHHQSDTNNNIPMAPRTASAGWTWAIFFVFCIPEVVSFVYCLRKVMMTRKLDIPNKKYIALSVIMEILHLSGAALLMFVVLPRLDSLQAALIINCVTFMPSVLNCITRISSVPPLSMSTVNMEHSRKDVLVRLGQCADVLAMVIQVVGLICIPLFLLDTIPAKNSTLVLHTVSAALMLTSTLWWENFLSPNCVLPVVKGLVSLQQRLRKSNYNYRYKLYVYLIPCKIVLMASFMLGFYRLNSLSQETSRTLAEDMSDLLGGIKVFFRDTTNFTYLDSSICKLTDRSAPLSALPVRITSPGIQAHDYWVVLIIQLLSAMLAMKLSVVACQILMQRWAFCLPLTLSSPFLVVATAFLTRWPSHAKASPFENLAGDIFPSYPAFRVYISESASPDFWDLFKSQYLWLWLVLFASQMWTTRHIWFGRNHVRLAKPETLFTLPMYHGLLTNEDLIMSRCHTIGYVSSTAEAERPRAQVYACVTMWHENKREMRQLIRSLVRLDEKQDPNAQNGDSSEQQYKLECHVFFDDAFDGDEVVEPTPAINTSIETVPCPLSNGHINQQTLTEDVAPDAENPNLLRAHSQNAANDNRRHELPRNFVPRRRPSTTVSMLSRLAEQTVMVATAITHEAPASVIKSPVNAYVKQFWYLLTQTTEVINPKIYELYAPYGACYVWMFDNGTRLFLHLKDKIKVKRRKRWSQVMYFHYIENLLNRSVSNPEEALTLDPSTIAARKKAMASNMFILALDGDMDFEPEAVQLMMDYMIKDKSLGAVCGRIHPIGGGPIVWYQQFEYAASQWLQKTTEHIIGSVLCSPGCFSLYRADAVIHHEVIRKYSEKADDSMECLRYDQGEDRWLCTLIMQQNFRIRYCALAAAKTFAPTGFDELFNQRRRWMSSSVANLIFILANSRRMVRDNEYISWFYIVYELLQFISALVTPGMIVLLLVASASMAFCIKNWQALAITVIPVFIFTFVCHKGSPRTQLLTAQVLSMVYTLLMASEIISVGQQIASDGFFSSPILLISVVAGLFLITSILHPYSFTCIFHGILYFFWIPSMYMLLPIYAVCNMNDMGWGTRENKTKAKQPLAENGDAAQTDGDDYGGSTSERQGFKCSFGNLFQCSCCDAARDEHVASTRKELDQIKRQNVEMLANLVQLQAKIGTAGQTTLTTVIENPSGQIEIRTKEEQQNILPLSQQDSVTRSNSLSQTYSSRVVQRENAKVDEILSRAEHCDLQRDEEKMWNGLVKGSLRPDNPNSHSVVRIVANLKDLRNRAVYIFFTVNALLVALIYLLHNNTGLYISIKNPFWTHVDQTPVVVSTTEDSSLDLWVTTIAGSRATPSLSTTGVPDASGSECTAQRFASLTSLNSNEIRLEPLGILFVVLYLSLLALQFLAMLIHRFMTFSHLLASTNSSPSQFLHSKTKSRTDDDAHRESGFGQSFQVPLIVSDNDMTNCTLPPDVTEDTMTPGPSCPIDTARLRSVLTHGGSNSTVHSSPVRSKLKNKIDKIDKMRLRPPEHAEISVLVHQPDERNNGAEFVEMVPV